MTEDGYLDCVGEQRLALHAAVTLEQRQEGVFTEQAWEDQLLEEREWRGAPGDRRIVGRVLNDAVGRKWVAAEDGAFAVTVAGRSAYGEEVHPPAADDGTATEADRRDDLEAALHVVRSLGAKKYDLDPRIGPRQELLVGTFHTWMARAVKRTGRLLRVMLQADLLRPIPMIEPQNLLLLRPGGTRSIVSGIADRSGTPTARAVEDLLLRCLRAAEEPVSTRARCIPDRATCESAMQLITLDNYPPSGVPLCELHYLAELTFPNLAPLLCFGPGRRGENDQLTEMLVQSAGETHREHIDEYFATRGRLKSDAFTLALRSLLERQAVFVSMVRPVSLLDLVGCSWVGPVLRASEFASSLLHSTRGRSIDDRTIRVLRSLTTSSRPITQEVIASKINSSRQTVQRCLQKLLKLGLVTRHPPKGGWSADPERAADIQQILGGGDHLSE